MNNYWIGVDLDGTLAMHEGFMEDDQVGAPIMPMLNRVKAWISEGKTIKIFTARAPHEICRKAITKWLIENGLPALEITNVKDFGMIELWDDRCVRINRNMGTRCCEN